jgi:hypothetical protein
VAGKLQAQPHCCRRHQRRRRTAEVVADRLLERIARLSDGAEILGAGRLHVLIDRTIVGEEFFQHSVGAVGERLVLMLHAAHRLEGLAGGARGEHLAEHQHGRDRGKSQTEAPADPQAGRAPAPATRYAWRERRVRRAGPGGFNDRIMHTT